jgi:histidyl-tRNA synthetase
VTFSNLLLELNHTRQRIDEALKAPVGAFIVIAEEMRRPDAIELANTLRQSGITADYCLQPVKVARQFQQAEAVRAKYAIVIGQEWPQLRIKLLAERTERVISKEELRDLLGNK